MVSGSLVGGLSVSALSLWSSCILRFVLLVCFTFFVIWHCSLSTSGTPEKGEKWRRWEATWGLSSSFHTANLGGPMLKLSHSFQPQAPEYSRPFQISLLKSAGGIYMCDVVMVDDLSFSFGARCRSTFWFCRCIIDRMLSIPRSVSLPTCIPKI